VDWPVVWFAFAVSALTGIAFGLAPAWQSRRVELSLTLKRGESRLAGVAGGGVRNVLVAMQIGISLVLLVGAGLLTESLWKLLKSPLGFVPDHVLTFEIKLPWTGKPEEVDSFYINVQHRIESLPGVSAVGMNDLVGTSVAQPRLNMVLLASFAVIALLLACVGIYGVVAYAAAQRKQEIGVRMALGATRTRILLLLMRHALLSAVSGLAAGTCVAAILTRLLRSQLYEVQPSDPRIYVASILVLLVPVFFATLRPAISAANGNPVDALRAD
jgi:FtsX-like permease family